VALVDSGDKQREKVTHAMHVNAAARTPTDTLPLRVAARSSKVSATLLVFAASSLRRLRITFSSSLGLN
jgi:hypothetical protein